MADLTILQLNIRGIKNKLKDLKCLVAESSPDIICINQSFLNNKSPTPSIKNYISYSHNRIFHGGGVMILINKNIKHSDVQNITIEGHEIIQC